MNLFDPPDIPNGYISRQGVREDHSDPTRTINLAKWVVTAPYTDENEEISLVTNFNFKKKCPQRINRLSHGKNRGFNSMCTAWCG